MPSYSRKLRLNLKTNQRCAVDDSNLKLLYSRLMEFEAQAFRTAGLAEELPFSEAEFLEQMAGKPTATLESLLSSGFRSRLQLEVSSLSCHASAKQDGVKD